MGENSGSPFEIDPLTNRPDAPLSLPRVNVIVTCFNYDRFVCDALNSVLTQIYTNFDCTVVDDASTDRSFDVIQQWISEKSDRRFRLIRNDRNLGQMGSIVEALATTEGEFVALLDADDFWLADFLMRHVEVHLNRAQPAGASCSDLLQVDADGHTLAGSTMVPASITADLRRKGSELKSSDIAVIGSLGSDSRHEPVDVRYVPPDMGQWYWSVTSGMVFRRSLVEILLPASTEELRLGADIYLMTLAHSLTGSFVIQNAFGGYRRHGSNNFSSLPVLGHAAWASGDVTSQNQLNAQRAMLQHLLSAYHQLSIAFPSTIVRKHIRSLFRALLLRGVDMDSPQVTEIIGRGQLMRDRFRAKIGFLRRGLT